MASTYEENYEEARQCYNELGKLEARIIKLRHRCFLGRPLYEAKCSVRNAMNRVYDYQEGVKEEIETIIKQGEELDDNDVR